MPKITLLPMQTTLEVPNDTNLLKALKEAGLYIKSSCGGCASCGDCVIKVHTGEKNLTPQTFEETSLLGNVYHITKERLSCQTQVLGDVTIDIGNHNEQKDALQRQIKTSQSKIKVKKKTDILEEKEKKHQKQLATTASNQTTANADTVGGLKEGGKKRPRPF